MKHHADDSDAPYPTNVGLAFGLCPAQCEAKLDPIGASRRE